MQSGNYRQGMTPEVKRLEQYYALITALVIIALVALFAWAMSSAVVPPHMMPTVVPPS